MEGALFRIMFKVIFSGMLVNGMSDTKGLKYDKFMYFFLTNVYIVICFKAMEWMIYSYIYSFIYICIIL